MDLNLTQASSVSGRTFFGRVSTWFFIVVGVVLRWWDLTIRPLHHDESIHVMFGKYFFDFPDFHFYKYNPEYHGPLLYNALRFVYDTFGDSVWSARALICLMGTVLVFLPAIFKRYLTEVSTVWLTAAIALSPTLIYWSSFVREDMFVIFGMVLMLYGIFLSPDRMKSFWVVMGVVLQYCSKENIYVTLALLWVMAIVDYGLRWIVTKTKEPFPFTFLAPIPMGLLVLYQLKLLTSGAASGPDAGATPLRDQLMNIAAMCGAALVLVDVFRPVWKGSETGRSLIYRTLVHVKTFRVECLVSFLLGAFVFVYLFSGGFRYQEGILDGLYRKGITYWLDKHHIERIKGPFLFHFYQLSWYETAFIIAVIFHSLHFFVTGQRWIKYGGMAVVILALVAGVSNIPSSGEPWNEPAFLLWKTLKAKDWFDVVGIVVLLSYPVFITLGHYLRQEWGLGAWGFLFSANCFTYSYLGEKVPWLSTYPLLVGFVYLALYFDAKRRERFVEILRANIKSSQIFLFFGVLFFTVTLVFVAEDYFRWDLLYPGTDKVSISGVLAKNQIMLMLSLIFSALAWVDERLHMFGKVHVGVFFLVILSIFTFRKAILANFDIKYRELTYISQVHTTQETLRVATRVRSEIENFDGGKARSVLVTGDAVWPLTWYFRDLPTYKFSATDDEKKGFDYIFQNTTESVPEGFVTQELKLRGWWVPDFRTMTLKRFLALCVNLQRWGDLGYSNVNFVTKK